MEFRSKIKFKWKIFFAIIFAILLMGVFYTGAQAITALYKQLAGVGNVDFINEVTVSDLKIVSPTKIQVVVTSISTTVAGEAYTVTLYLDGANSATSIVSWNSGQIPGTSKTINFSGLSLASVTSIGVEVTR